MKLALLLTFCFSISGRTYGQSTKRINRNEMKDSENGRDKSDTVSGTRFSEFGRNTSTVKAAPTKIRDASVMIKNHVTAQSKLIVESKKILSEVAGEEEALVQALASSFSFSYHYQSPSPVISKVPTSAPTPTPSQQNIGVSSYSNNPTNSMTLSAVPTMSPSRNNAQILLSAMPSVSPSRKTKETYSPISTLTTQPNDAQPTVTPTLQPSNNMNIPSKPPKTQSQGNDILFCDGYTSITDDSQSRRTETITYYYKVETTGYPSEALITSVNGAVQKIVLSQLCHNKRQLRENKRILSLIGSSSKISGKVLESPKCASGGQGMECHYVQSEMELIIEGDANAFSIDTVAAHIDTAFKIIRTAVELDTTVNAVNYVGLDVPQLQPELDTISTAPFGNNMSPRSQNPSIFITTGFGIFAVLVLVGSYKVLKAKSRRTKTKQDGDEHSSVVDDLTTSTSEGAIVEPSRLPAITGMIFLEGRAIATGGDFETQPSSDDSTQATPKVSNCPRMIDHASGKTFLFSERDEIHELSEF